MTRLSRFASSLALVACLGAGCSASGPANGAATGSTAPTSRPEPSVTAPSTSVSPRVTAGPATTAPIPATTAPIPAPSSGLRVVHTPATLVVDESLSPGQCHLRVINASAGAVLADPECTPGAVDPAVNQADIGRTICSPRGYTSTVRPPVSETDRFKAVAESAYGESYSRTTELDHLVPLELGGASSASNLWPEPNRSGATSTTNPKDAVENRLHRDVCDGTMTLAAAQQAMATDWTTAGR